jgi:hypothetical protein
MKKLSLNLCLSMLITGTFLSTAHAGSFTCDVTSTDGARVMLQPVSAEETYMTEGLFSGLQISAYQNEDGFTYSVQATEQGDLLVSATLPFYPDAKLIFRHQGTLVVVQCTNF